MVLGYPKGLTKDEIPYVAQIIRVADEYDAIVAKRQYKTHVNISETLKDLIDDSEPQNIKKTIALDQLSLNYQYGKLNKKVLKVLFKVVIDDNYFEIDSLQKYIKHLKTEAKNLKKLDKYNKNLKILSDYENAVKVREEREQLLFKEIELINKLKKKI